MRVKLLKTGLSYLKSEDRQNSIDLLYDSVKTKLLLVPAQQFDGSSWFVEIPYVLGRMIMAFVGGPFFVPQSRIEKRRRQMIRIWMMLGRPCIITASKPTQFRCQQNISPLHTQSGIRVWLFIFTRFEVIGL